MLRILLIGAAANLAEGNSNPTLGTDGVLHVTHDSLYAINSDGSVKWIFDADAPITMHVEGLNNTVYATTPGDQVYTGPAALFAVDSLDGHIKWKHQVGGKRELEFGNHPPVVAADGTIYLTTRDGRIPWCNSTTFEAIDPAGALKWNFTVDGCGSMSAVGGSGPERGTLFVESSKSLDALWPHNGHLKWSVDLYDHWHLIAFAEDGNAFLIQGEEYHKTLSSLSNEDGSVLWSYPFTQWVGPFGDLKSWWITTNSRNELYVSGVESTETGDECHHYHTCNCNIRVFDVNGSILRHFPCLSTPDNKIIHDNYPQYGDEEDVFVTTIDEHTTPHRGNVLAHSGTTGHMLWNVSMSDPLNSIAHFGGAGTVLVSSSGNNEHNHAYAIQDGKVAWSVETGGAWQQVMSEDGTTYVQGWICQEEKPDCKQKLEIVAVGVDGVEKWRYTPAEAAATVV